MGWRTPVVVLCVGCWLTSFAAAEQVAFRQVYAVGDKLDMSQSTDLSVTMSAGGQQMQQNLRQVRSATMTVDAVDPSGRVTKATIAFGRDCADEMDGGPMMGGRQTQPSPLAGKTMTVTQNGNDPKDLRFEGATLDPAAANEVVQLFRNDNSMMPTTPVAVGDTWKLDPSHLQGLVPPGTQGDLQGTGKVTAISTVNGRETAAVDLDATLSGNSPEGKMSMRFTGKGTFDTQTSRPIELQLTGPFTASGQEMGPQGPMQMDVKGQVNIALRSTITGTPVATAGGRGAFDPQPGNTGGNKPGFGPGIGGGGAPGAGGGGNPLDDDAAAPAAPAAPSGVYTDGKLTLDLSGGSIKLGEKQFALGETTYDAGARVMKGEFTSGADRFPFTATFTSADQCEFESGTRKATLKKQAPRNPLDD